MKIWVFTDCQDDFINGVLGSPDAQKTRDRIVKLIKSGVIKKGDIVVITLDTHYGDYLSTQEGRNLKIPHTVFLHPGWLLDGQILNALEEREVTIFFVTKSTFGSLELFDALNEDSDIDWEMVEEIIFVGFDTDICVVSNVLITKAKFPETLISVIADCCAGSTPENHQAALAVMRSCQVKIIEKGEYMV